MTSIRRVLPWFAALALSCAGGRATRDEAAPAVSERAPTAADPVVVTASLAPSRIAPGATSTLSVRVAVASSWHIYRRDAPAGANAPTQLDIDLPHGIEWASEWSDPTPTRDASSRAEVLERSFVFTRALRADADAPAATHELAGSMSYQACDPLRCRPPERRDWHATLVVVAASSPAAAANAAAPPPATDKIALKLLYVGPAKDARGSTQARSVRARDHVEFLGARFADVRSAELETFDRKSAEDVDVVLLDWSQQDIKLDELAKLQSPIGPREEWKKPLVLLGSAGLLLGVPWQLKGGFG